MSTVSWTGVEKINRYRILNFEPNGGGPTIRTLVGETASGSLADGKLALDQAPDDLTGLWGVLRTLDMPQRGGDGGLMIDGLHELIWYGLTRKTAAQVKVLVTQTMEAWNGWTYGEAGGTIVAKRITSAFPIPYISDPADRELVAWRMLLPFRCTPIFLTRYAA